MNKAGVAEHKGQHCAMSQPSEWPPIRLGLVLGVLGAHVVALQVWSTAHAPRGRTAPAARAVMRVSLVPQAPRPVLEPTPAPLPPPLPPPPIAPPAPPSPVPLPRPWEDRAELPPTVPVAPETAAPRPVVAALDVSPAELPAAQEGPLLRATSDPAPDPAHWPTNPPPRYRVTVPAAGSWSYRVEQGPLHGQGHLDWQHEAGRYRIAQQVNLPGRPSQDWVSQGAVRTDALGGLSPERLLERRRERPLHAVNFQHDKGLLSFSDTALTAPLHDGLQDRLSALVQLVGIVQAWPTPWTVGERITLRVAAPRGGLADWVWEVVAVSAEGLHLRREPTQPYDWRVELWLASSQGHWPQRMRWQRWPGGEPITWTLQEDTGVAH